MRALSVLAAVLPLAVLSSTQAGEYASTSYSTVDSAAYGGFYRAMELDVDLFGAYAIEGLSNEDGVPGGGAAVQFFPWKWLGFGGEGLLYDTEGDTTGSFAGNVFLRAPLGQSRVALYGFAGLGWLVNANELDEDDFDDARDRAEDDDDAKGDEDALFETHVGLGVEVRLTPHVGLFGDVRQTWVESEVDDYSTARVGLRFAF